MWQVQTRIYLARSQVKRHEKVFFEIFVFLNIFLKHYIHEKIFNIFSTNLHLICFPFNLIF